MNFTSFKNLPKQAIPDSEKDEQWGKDSVDACEGLVLLFNDNIRESRLNKQINYNLHNGIMSKADLDKISNPYGLQGQTFPSTPRFLPISNPYFKKLLGEEYKRRFDWHLSIINEDAVSEKLTQQKQIVNDVVTSIFQEQLQLTDEQRKDPEVAKQVEAQLQEALDKSKSWREEREEGCTNMLEYYERQLDLKTLFNNGYEDALIAAEEIYCADEINNEPVVRRCNPLMTYYLTNPHSHYVEDSDIVVEEQYIPLGEVIDRYYRFLKPEEIKELEKMNFNGGVRGNNGAFVNYSEGITWADPDSGMEFGAIKTNMSTDFNNIRVVRCVWRSIRQIAILHYLDEEGNEMEEPIGSTYKPNKSAGEWVEKINIGEFWEGTKIANKYYVKVQPRSIQFRRLNNISHCQSGYIGSIYNTNSSKALSLMDIIKPYQYSIITMAYRTELAFMKSKGKIGFLDKAWIPDGMDVDSWMYFAEMMGWAVVDSFKEGNKGASMGKLVSAQATRSDAINLEMGNYIQQHILYMQYLEGQIEKVTGINDARKGNISASAGLGVTQQAQESSSEMTEQYFRIHDNVKLRVMAALLETCKFCLKNGNKTFQYILSDMTSKIFSIDGESINEAEYGIMMSDATNDAETLSILKRAMEMAIQTGKVDASQLLDITSNTSMSAIKHKLKKNIADQNKQAQANIEAEQKAKAEDIKLRAEHEKALLQLEYDKLDREDLNKQLDRELELQVKEIEAYAFDEGPNTADIGAAADQALKQQDINLKYLNEQSKLSQAERQIVQDRMLKEKELQLKKETEQKKIEAIDHQSRNQEKMQDKQLKHDKEMADKKFKLEEKLMKDKMALEKLKVKAVIAKSKQKPKAK
jgi:hypothetical protein